MQDCSNSNALAMELLQSRAKSSKYSLMQWIPEAVHSNSYHSLRHLGPFLRAWINFNPSMDKWLYPLQRVRWNYLSFPKLQWCSCKNLGMAKQFHHTRYWASDYLPMLGLKLNDVNKKGPCDNGLYIYIYIKKVCHLVITLVTLLVPFKISPWCVSRR